MKKQGFRRVVRAEDDDEADNEEDEDVTIDDE